ncbi:hypothetical protein BJ944DRAFT_185162 [Cunninghamella echinulata]|nr:hypothetical protein BJ944DRAFT_185162 [Cunninghamella echinulata]
MTGRVVRSLKNYAKGFSEAQIKVRKATSNDAWGPSGKLMNEIAQLTNKPHDFIEIMDMIDKRLNDKGKNWRHVFKALLLLDYCLHVGSENVVSYAKENLYVIKTLKEFQHIDEIGNDVGTNVRRKANDIVNLLQDTNRLKDQRKKRKEIRDKIANVSDYISEVAAAPKDNNTDTTKNNDDENGTDYYSELKFALKESKRLAAEEEQKRKQGEDDDLAIAIKLSEQENLKNDKETQSQHQQHTDNGQRFSAIFNPYSQSQQKQQVNQVSKVLQYDNNNSNNIQFQSKNNPFLQQPSQIDLFNDNVQQQQLFNTINKQNPFYFTTTNTNSQQVTSFPFQTSQATGPSRNPFTQQTNHSTSLFDNNLLSFNNNNTNNNSMSTLDPFSTTIIQK